MAADVHENAVHQALAQRRGDPQESDDRGDTGGRDAPSNAMRWLPVWRSFWLRGQKLR